MSVIASEAKQPPPCHCRGEQKGGQLWHGRPAHDLEFLILNLFRISKLGFWIW